MKKNLAPLNTINGLKSVLLIDNNDIDNFVNSKILENYGVTTIMSCRSVKSALNNLKETDIKYQLILVNLYLQMIDGFEFIDLFFELNLHKKHGEICLLSASLDPLHKEKAEQRNVRFIDKPFSVEKLRLNK